MGQFDVIVTPDTNKLNISRAGKQFKPGLEKSLKKLMRVLIREAKRNATSRILTKRTGALARSVEGEVTPQPEGFTLVIKSDTDYSWIHEAGGHAGRNHATKIRKRLWLTRILTESKDDIRKEMNDFVGKLGR